MHFKIKHFSKIHSSRRNVVIPCWDVIVAIGYHSLSRRDVVTPCWDVTMAIAIG